MTKNIKGIIYVILSAILFGVMPFLTKSLYDSGANAYTATCFKAMIGAIILYVYLKIKKESIKLTKEENKKILILSIFNTLTVVFLNLSYELMDTGLATTLHFTYPVIVILLNAIVLKEKLNLTQYLSAILCLLGMILLYNPNGDIKLIGVVIALLSGLVYAIYIVTLGKSNLTTVKTSVITFYLLLYATFESGIIAIGAGEFSLAITPSGWFICFIGALFTSVIALILFQQGVFYCGDMKASMLSTFEPITSIVVGVIFLAEVVHFKEIAGISLILLSTILILLPKR